MTEAQYEAGDSMPTAQAVAESGRHRGVNTTTNLRSEAAAVETMILACLRAKNFSLALELRTVRSALLFAAQMLA